MRSNIKRWSSKMSTLLVQFISHIVIFGNTCLIITLKIILINVYSKDFIFDKVNSLVSVSCKVSEWYHTNDKSWFSNIFWFFATYPEIFYNFSFFNFQHCDIFQPFQIKANIHKFRLHYCHIIVCVSSSGHI